jgi:hypothetical protein
LEDELKKANDMIYSLQAQQTKPSQRAKTSTSMHNSNNNSASLDQSADDLDRENRKLKKELEAWTKNYQQLELMYVESQKGKNQDNGRYSMGNKRDQARFSDPGGNMQAEKAKYEATIRGLLAEVDQLKVHPNYSYKISVLVKDLEQRIGKLFDASIPGGSANQSARSVSPISANNASSRPVTGESRRVAVGLDTLRGQEDTIPSIKSSISRQSRSNRSGTINQSYQRPVLTEETEPNERRETKSTQEYKEPLDKRERKPAQDFKEPIIEKRERKPAQELKEPIEKKEFKSAQEYKEPIEKRERKPPQDYKDFSSRREVRDYRAEPKEAQDKRDPNQKNDKRNARKTPGLSVSGNLHSGGVSGNLTVNTSAPYYFVEEREDKGKSREEKMAADKGPVSSRPYKSGISSARVGSNNQGSPRGGKNTKSRNFDKV